MMSALEKARQAKEEASAAAYAAIVAHNKLLHSGTYINEYEEKALIAAGLPMPENSFNAKTWQASYDNVCKTAKAEIAARKALDPLVLADMLGKYRENQK